MMAYLLPIGTRIRFTKTLEEGPNEEHPAIIYAAKGDLGRIVGHGTHGRYWATWDRWEAPFGISTEEFKQVNEDAPTEQAG